MPRVTYQEQGQLGEIVIDNPPQNLFSGEVLTDLSVAIKEAAASDARAVLLRAEGDDYSAGADVSVFSGVGEAEAAELAAAVIGYIHAIEGLSVPTVALIQGQCYAGAVETCMACDLIWVAEGSQIGQIEAAAGGIPYAGGTQRLASRIGVARAAEMVLTAAVLPPEMLQSWGAINRVLPADRLLEEGRAFGQRLASGPTLAHKAIKQILHAWRSGGVAAADRVNLAEGPVVMTSQDLKDGIASLQQYGLGHATFHGR
jgi:enoyl-CoA hydratase/carnithine racemase